MISRFAQLPGVTPMQSLPAGSALAAPIKTPVDQFVRQSVNSAPPQFAGRRLVTGAAVTVAVIAGGVVLLNLPETLPPGTEVNRPVGKRIVLNGERSKPVTAEVIIGDVRFVFSGNILNGDGEVDEARLAACLKKILTDDNKVREDIFQFKPDKDSVYCDLNGDDGASWRVISNTSIQDWK
jgi:hypothetical protein